MSRGATEARSCCSNARAYGPATVAREADAVSAVPRLISAAVVAKYSACGQTRACAVPVDGIQPERRHGGQRGLSAHATRLLGDQKKQPKYERTVRRAYEKYLSGLSATSSWEPSGSATGCGPSRSRHQRRVRAGIAHLVGVLQDQKVASPLDATPRCAFGGCLRRSRVGHEVLGGADVDHGAGDRRKVHGLMTLQALARWPYQVTSMARKSRSTSRTVVRSAEAPIAPVDLRSSAVVGSSPVGGRVCPVMLPGLQQRGREERPATSRHRGNRSDRQHRLR